jgi:SRSO17 transposase
VSSPRSGASPNRSCLSAPVPIEVIAVSSPTVMAGTDAVVLQARAADAEVDAVVARLRRRFRRRAAHHHAGAYLRGLLGDVERKNGWQLAEHAGYRHPRTIQRVLDRSAWDPEAVREDLCAFVVEHLGDPDGVLVVDETGFVKKGTKSCGVARQYSGTAGRIENCQIGVFLGYGSRRGRAGVDRALYLPKAWAQDAERRAEADVPEPIPFRTKPQLALEMLERALDAEVPAKWVVAEEVYGSDGKLRRALEARDQAYVLAVKSTEMPTTWPPYAPPRQVAVSAVVESLAPEAWQRLSCGDGAQGERIYDWAAVPLRPSRRAGWVHALLVRRHPTEPDEIAYYLVYAPVGTPLPEIVRAAGSRWAIEDVFKLAKGQVGLDQYEVRSWTGWHRHTILALLALAILAVVTAEKRGARPTVNSSQSASRSCAAC